MKTIAPWNKRQPLYIPSVSVEGMFSNFLKITPFHDRKRYICFHISVVVVVEVIVCA